MKILFSSVPGLGHVNPMLPVATALRDHLGHEVRWAVTADRRDYLEAQGFVVHPCGLGEERWGRMKEITGAERLVGSDTPEFFGTLFGTVLTPPMLIDMSQVIDQWTPDLFVHDRNEFAAAPLAASIGRCHVTSNFGAHPPEESLTAAAVNVEHLWDQLGLAMPAVGGVYQHAFIDIYPEALQKKEQIPCRRLFLRPADRAATAQPEWWSKLEPRPTVYLTFGTVFNDLAITQLALDAVSDLDINVVATTGREPGDALRAGRNTRVLAYLPQQSVLSAVSAVLSHAGSGTFLGALAHGVPQVCVPQGADQFINARLGRTAGVATVLEPAHATVEAVREAITDVLSDETMRRRTEQVADEIAAMPDARMVAEQVVALAGYR